MPGTAVIVFTGKNIDTLLADGGSSCWVLNPGRARVCEYVVCTWNSRSRVGDPGTVSHGAAFLVGRISGTAPCRRERIPGRKILRGHLVQFDKYAVLDVADVWARGRRNPVAYTDDVERLLGLRLGSLRWRSV